MADLDYAKLGLKCGLEIHQQLDTGKLFCRCPSVLREDAPHMRIRRVLRPVPSEMGEYDKAALEAFRKGLTYVYEAYNENTCLIELDEEPPKQPDKEALETALKVALMLKANVLDELLVMRKAVIDGSNTSGFQRTMLVATGGRIEHSNGSTGVQTLVLEEDAARPVAKSESEIVYRLDRLGIPLIELATEPTIKSPETAGTVALAIGSMLRLTGKAKRGLGTIRQDLNVSIAEGARVEIKGVQKLELIDEYVKREVVRQAALVELRGELLKRGFKAELLWKEKPKDITALLKNTESALLKKCFAKGEIALALKLPKFRGLTGKEMQPGRRFGTELSSYAKAKAGVGGIIHLDELPNYGITAQEAEKISKELGCGKEDGFAVVCGQQGKAQKAVEVILERCADALKGVPEETRNALEDGNTEYSRPLPGAARMYPETDLEPVRVSKEGLRKIAKELPKSAEERKKHYVHMLGLSEKLAEKMKLSNDAIFFERLVAKGCDATSAAVLLLEGLVELRRKGVDTDKISERMVEETLLAMKRGAITKNVALEVLAEWVKRESATIDEIMGMLGIAKAESGEVEKIVRELVRKNLGLVKEKGEHAVSALMGVAMKELRGKASGQEVSALLKKEIEKLLRG